MGFCRLNTHWHLKTLFLSNCETNAAIGHMCGLTLGDIMRARRWRGRTNVCDPLNGDCGIDACGGRCD
jgi:hypothetical protein